MRGLNRFAWLAAPLLAVAQPAAAFLFVSGSNATSGDLVAVWVKNNFELIVNLGPVEQIGYGTVTSFTLPAQFGGSLSGGKFTALTVPNPDAAYTGLGLDPAPPQPNIALTTNGDPLTITPVQVGDAQAALDTPSGGQTWLALLNSIPAAGSADVVSNGDDEALISASLFAAYTTNVGFASDAIANTIALSTAVAIDPESTDAPYEIPLYEVFQTLEQVGEDFVFGTEVTELGVFHGDAGGSGYAILSLEPVPEAGAGAVGAAALAGLAALAHGSRAAARRV